MKRILLTLCSLALLTPAFAASVKDLRYKTNNADTITITDCNENASGDLIIPATINGKKVTLIGERAFWCCSSLTSVTIPSSVTSIGNYAFDGCS
ncbi:MAG: leucine-rich repeat protein, partial [bacterium]|nr:leucine-rich repeat protein [bacterium]